MNRDFVLAAFPGPLRGHLILPPAPRGLVLAARLHDGPDSESDLTAHGLVVLSMPLPGEQEMRYPDAADNVPLLTQRFLDLLDLIRRDGYTESLTLGIFASAHGTPPHRLLALQPGEGPGSQVVRWFGEHLLAI